MSDALAANLQLLNEANLAATRCQYCHQFGHELEDCQIHARHWQIIIGKQEARKHVTAWEKVLGGFWWFAVGLVIGALLGKGCGM